MRSSSESFSFARSMLAAVLLNDPVLLSAAAAAVVSAAAGAAAWVAAGWEPPHPVSRPKVTAVAQRIANSFFFIYDFLLIFALL